MSPAWCARRCPLTVLTDAAEGRPIRSVTRPCVSTSTSRQPKHAWKAVTCNGSEHPAGFAASHAATNTTARRLTLHILRQQRNRRHSRTRIRRRRLDDLTMPLCCPTAVRSQRVAPRSRRSTCRDPLCGRSSQPRRVGNCLRRSGRAVTVRHRSCHPQARWAVVRGTNHSFHGRRSTSDVLPGGAPGLKP